MKLSFFGADQCHRHRHCLEINGKTILVDCGLQQGRDEISNEEFPFNPANVDYVLVTHAHIDHSGRIPKLIRQGFHGEILTTRLTADLMRIIFAGLCPHSGAGRRVEEPQGRAGGTRAGRAAVYH